MQRPQPDGTKKYQGIFKTIVKVTKEEGPTALFRGLTAAVKG
jgi:hypothetical protein